MLEVNKIEKEVSQIAKDTLSIYTTDRFLGGMIMDTDGAVVRNLKRGFLWECSSNLQDEVLTQDSRFRQMDYYKIIDNTAYNAMVSAFVEQTNLSETVDNLVNVVPASDMKDALVTALLLAVARKVGGQLENTVVKNITSLWN